MKPEDKILLFIVIISAGLILHGATTEVTDKKTADSTGAEIMAGTAGLAGAVARKGFALTWPLVGLILGGMALSPNIFTGWINSIRNLFNPAPAIPSWVWIVGFVLLFLMVIGNRR